ncbi:MAG: family 20 glycosylhydrolase [Lentisphaerae bacterium]|jgi:hypothetical protein|nr:family 20 glycosylhydrolase [Lentisphaerota bacterium]MBT7846224.1 family 20 glycosylhydrolase [Lentisphaerota bacterium]
MPNSTISTRPYTRTRLTAPAATLVLCLLLPVCKGAAVPAWEQFGEHAAQAVEPVRPSPLGEGHLGRLDTGASVRLCYPLPAKEALAAFWLRPCNVVAYTGRGTRYELLIRRDSPNGALVYTGPVATNGDRWNAQNRDRIDLTASVTAADRERGHIDLFISGAVTDDGWTVYRHCSGRPMPAFVVVLDETTRQALHTMRSLAAAGVSLIPLPSQIELSSGPPMIIDGRTTIAAPPTLNHTASELRDIVAERTGVTLRLTPAAQEATTTITLLVSPTGATVNGAYTLAVTDRGAMVTGADAAGAFYGAMTLAQLIHAAAGAVIAPACSIDDAPAFRERIVQYDIARGQTVHVPYVKRLIRELARCKTNALLFYMEDDFRFREYPFLGRDGTFTHAKARELSSYARRYHVRLIPQFESLGHAGAVLAHEEFADLREAGRPGVFCTLAPRTWDVLDRVFSELAEAFPDSPYIHVGGDEFEHGFARCGACRAYAAEHGAGGLYALHMTRLSELVKKHGRTMMFWPSHRGPSDELSDMTLKNHAAMAKDCIPTEWIYHGPASYPTIRQYQDCGFADIFCCPAVVSYSRIWPDFPTTFRGIRGFYRAGATAHCGGAYCTTWEFRYGALLENSMMGLIYAAECSWNPASTSRADFFRRFAGWWFDVHTPGSGTLVEQALFAPFPRTPQTASLSSKDMRRLFTALPSRICADLLEKKPAFAENVSHVPELMPVPRRKLAQLSAVARRNALTLRAAETAFGLLELQSMKISIHRRIAAILSEAATEERSSAAATAVSRAAQLMSPLHVALNASIERYREFVERCGGSRADLAQLQAQADDATQLTQRLDSVAEQIVAGKMRPRDLSIPLSMLLKRNLIRIGTWSPEQVSEEPVTLRFDVTTHLTRPEAFEVEWEYTRGAHGLSIQTTRLLADGKTLSEDKHHGWAGAGSSGNVYTLNPTGKPLGAKLVIEATVSARGGNDSAGTLWLIR